MKRARRAVLRAFAVAERPAAWGLLVGATVTLAVVGLDLVRLGQARWGTLLIAAGLLVDGFGAVQQAEQDEDPDA